MDGGTRQDDLEEKISVFERDVGLPLLKRRLSQPRGVDWFYRLAVVLGFRPRTRTRYCQASSAEPPLPYRRRADPSPEEIQRACVEIRRGWSLEEFKRRRVLWNRQSVDSADFDD